MPTQEFLKLWCRTENLPCPTSSPTFLSLTSTVGGGESRCWERSRRQGKSLFYLLFFYEKEGWGLNSSSDTPSLGDLGERSSLWTSISPSAKEGWREGDRKEGENGRTKEVKEGEGESLKLPSRLASPAPKFQIHPSLSGRSSTSLTSCQPHPSYLLVAWWPWACYPGRSTELGLITQFSLSTNLQSPRHVGIGGLTWV